MVPPRRKPEACGSPATCLRFGVSCYRRGRVSGATFIPCRQLFGVHRPVFVFSRGPFIAASSGSVLFGPSPPIPACRLARCLGVVRAPADRQPSVSQRSRCRTPKAIPGQCSLGPFMSSVDCPSCMDTSFRNCTVVRGRPPPPHLLSCIRQSD